MQELIGDNSDDKVSSLGARGWGRVPHSRRCCHRHGHVVADIAVVTAVLSRSSRPSFIVAVAAVVVAVVVAMLSQSSWPCCRGRRCSGRRCSGRRCCGRCCRAVGVAVIAAVLLSRPSWSWSLRPSLSRSSRVCCHGRREEVRILDHNKHPHIFRVNKSGVRLTRSSRRAARTTPL